MVLREAFRRKNPVLALADNNGSLVDERVFIRQSDAQSALEENPKATTLRTLNLQFPAQLIRPEDEQE